MTLKEKINKFFDNYNTIKQWEKSGKVYEALGVKLWNKYYPNGGSKISIANEGIYTDCKNKSKSRAEGLQNYKTETKRLEAIHLTVAPIMGLMFLANYMENMGTGMYLLSGALNMLNTYPIIASRYNRNRAERLEAMYETQLEQNEQRAQQQEATKQQEQDLEEKLEVKKVA